MASTLIKIMGEKFINYKSQREDFYVVVFHLGDNFGYLAFYKAGK
jgi:hypothetical protein